MRSYSVNFQVACSPFLCINCFQAASNFNIFVRVSLNMNTFSLIIVRPEALLWQPNNLKAGRLSSQSFRKTAELEEAQLSQLQSKTVASVLYYRKACLPGHVIHQQSIFCTYFRRTLNAQQQAETRPEKSITLTFEQF